MEEAPNGEFQKGDIVATAMGGMGRLFDGGYAEYTCVPAGQIQKLQTKLSWDVLGACGEMLQTAYGSLFNSLQMKEGETLLVRGVHCPNAVVATPFLCILLSLHAAM